MSPYLGWSGIFLRMVIDCCCGFRVRILLRQASFLSLMSCRVRDACMTGDSPVVTWSRWGLLFPFAALLLGSESLSPAYPQVCGGLSSITCGHMNPWKSSFLTGGGPPDLASMLHVGEQGDGVSH